MTRNIKVFRCRPILQEAIERFSSSRSTVDLCSGCSNEKHKQFGSVDGTTSGRTRHKLLHNGFFQLRTHCQEIQTLCCDLLRHAPLTALVCFTLTKTKTVSLYLGYFWSVCCILCSIRTYEFSIALRY